MATLPEFKIRYDSSKTTEANVLEAGFGDGYTQRAANGINSLKDIWNLNGNIDSTSADTLIAFFEARKGSESFGWTPPGESVEKRWTCKIWDKVFLDSPNLVNLTATFIQTYDLN